MTKIADLHTHTRGAPVFICDFSPPRGAFYDGIDAVRSLGVDCISIPYNPGKAVYANSAIAAHTIKSATGMDVAFTIATRDMNILAAQSLLVGAALLGLENTIVVRGDDFAGSELRQTEPVHDRTPTALIRSIAALNSGIDFRGRQFDAPTNFCIGAAIDTSRPVEREVALAKRKIDAGAHFFITQPGFSPNAPLHFREAYTQTYGDALPIPIFFGIQVMAPGSIAFTEIPQSVSDDLNAGVSPADIASRAVDEFLAAGMSCFYLMPPILGGGKRDYDSAAKVIRRFRA
ncbi:MAG: methylenetetrahydrofolate reductase [Chloroflexota bacterium]|nr:methylenetetrahydrofolate reductase [Chloroflexota bacterium]